MNPCSHNRKQIAALALGHLDDESATALRAHLESCTACREYLQELTRLTATMKSAEPAAEELPATTDFHRRVVTEVKQSTRAPVNVGNFIRAKLLNWRIALPAGVGILAILILVQVQPHITPPNHVGPEARTQPIANANLAPTIANYDMVMGQSLDRFDQLLTEQSKKNLPSARLYTASTFAANKPD